MEVLPLISRILHIASAIALVGGWVYMLVSFVPALRLVERGLSDSILEVANRRFYRVSHAAALLLVLTGAYNWWLNNAVYNAPELKPLGQALIGTKAMIGGIVVLIVFLSAFRVLPGTPTKWAKVNLVLSAIVVILGAVLRAQRLSVM